MKLSDNSEESKRIVHDFVCRIERSSPYGSSVCFNIVESESSFSARLEVVSNSLEILITKKANGLAALIEEFDRSFEKKLKPWLEGRFSAQS